MKVMRMWCLYQNILLHKCNAFSTLIKHLSGTMTVTFAVWSETAKLAPISFSFFTISWIEETMFPCYCCCSVTQLYLTLCHPMDCSMSGLPVPHHLLEFAHSYSLHQWCHPAISSSDAILTIELSNLSIWFFSLKSRTFTFPLKKRCYGISLASLTCEHRYSCGLGPLSSKIRVTWTQALQYHGS